MLPWRRAWSAAHLGAPGDGAEAAGFYAREGPAAHFRTSAGTGDGLARALAALLAGVDARLGRPGRLQVVDVGAGDGRLPAALLAAAPPDLAGRLDLVAVDVRPAPVGLDPRVRWVRAAWADGWTAPGGTPDPRGAPAPASPAGVVGLVLAAEWLDDLPADVVEVDAAGRVRVVLVDPATGAEDLGPALDDAAGCAGVGVDAARARDWLARWWPLGRPGTPPGARAEVGWPRDDAWADLVGRVAAGCALAVDYGHVRGARPPRGSLAGYAAGRPVRPVPDGRANLTAGVAVDACAAAAAGPRRTASAARQAGALAALGVRDPLPPADLAGADPAAYVAALRRSSATGVLRDPAGLGAHWWLRADVG